LPLIPKIFELKERINKKLCKFESKAFVHHHFTTQTNIYSLNIYLYVKSSFIDLGLSVFNIWISTSTAKSILNDCVVKWFAKYLLYGTHARHFRRIMCNVMVNEVNNNYAR